MKTIQNKIIALCISILIISMTFTISFSLNSSVVSADEQVGCCDLTKSGLVCQETTRSLCESGFHSGQACSQVGSCSPGTCIPPEGRCMSQKTKAECDAVGGFHTSQAIEEIAVCQTGCCGIAEGIKAEILQQKECKELAISLGYDPELDVEFDTSVTNQAECFKKYATQDKGCCVLGGGQCEYGVRESCTTLGGNFIPLAGNKYCKDVTQCAATPHSYCDCGQVSGTEFDIYWYDSQGSQEEIVKNIDECENAKPSNYKIGDCRYPEKMCFMEVTGEVYCKSTSCHIQGQAQEIIEYLDSDGFPKIASGDKVPLVKSVSFSKTLLTGQSTCYNFFTYLDGTTNNENELYERSTGLQNQIIHCRLGELVVEGLGTDREKLCVVGEQGTPTQHATVKENEWEECTGCGGEGFLGIGDLFGPFPPLGRSLAATLGGYCDAQSCQDYGDCVYHEDYPSFIGLSTSIGSCDPKYPPGTVEACSQCGRGGDGLWNICDKTECTSLGDCYFSPDSPWEGMAWGIILSLVSTYMYRVNLIPGEFALCTFPGALVGCNPVSLLSDRYNRYVKGPIGPFVGMLSFWNDDSGLGRTLGIITTASGAIAAISTITGFFKK